MCASTGISLRSRRLNGVKLSPRGFGARASRLRRRQCGGVMAVESSSVTRRGVGQLQVLRRATPIYTSARVRESKSRLALARRSGSARSRRRETAIRRRHARRGGESEEVRGRRLLHRGYRAYAGAVQRNRRRCRPIVAREAAQSVRSLRLSPDAIRFRR